MTAQRATLSATLPLFSATAINADPGTESQGVSLHIMELTDHEQAKGPIRSGVANSKGPAFLSRRLCPVECAY